MTATLRESWETVFTDGDWLVDVAFMLDSGAGGETPEDVTQYDHYLTLKRRTSVLGASASPILLTTEDGTLQVTAPNLVGPRVRAPQLQTWDEGVYDFEHVWRRADGVKEPVLVGTLRIQKGLSLGGSFANLPLPAAGPSLTVIRGPGQARVVRAARGAAGWNGWTLVPAMDATTAPPKLLMKVIDWAGGGGAKPTVGAWVGQGGLVTDPADATDFGGATTAAAIAALNAAVAAMQQATAEAIAQVNAAKQASQDQTALAAQATSDANAAASNATDQAAVAGQVANNAMVVVAAAASALEEATGQEIVSLSAPRFLTPADNGKLLAFIGAAPALLYVPPGLPDGFRIEVMKAGTADVFVVGVGGVTVGGVAGKTGLTTQYASELVRWVGANNYAVTDGEASAAPPSINFPDFSKARASGQALFWFA